MVLRRASAVALSLLAVGAAGCGSTTKDSAGNFKGEPKAVASAVDDLQSAGRDRNSGKMCGELFSAALVARIKAASKQTCEKALDESLKDVDGFKLEVVKNGITINGTTATAKVKTQSGTDDHRQDTIQLVKEPQRRGGRTEQVWKLSTLAG